LPLVVCLAVVLVTAPAPAQKKEKKVEPPRKGGDHGMVLSTAMDVAVGKLKDTIKLTDTKNYVFRGKLITLNKERTIHMCFDTELMRVAGLWKGPYPNDAADKNMGPEVKGDMLLRTRVGPGWANHGDFKDPRPGEGPMPKEHAHYKGLYLHKARGESHVALSYTVGKTQVYECPEAWEEDGRIIFTRTFNFGPSPEAQELKLGYFATLAGKDEPKTPRFLAEVIKEKEGRVTSAELIDQGAARNIFIEKLDAVRLSTEKGEMTATIPPLPKGGIFRISFVFGAEGATAATITKRYMADPYWYNWGSEEFWFVPGEITTRIIPGKVDGKSPYVQDVIELPEKNPWNASVRFAGLDFSPDGRAILTTWDGDVWLVSHLDDKRGQVEWTRIAAGLQHPLGVKIVNDQIYTAGRDQITRLGGRFCEEATFFENINNDPGLTLQRHEFVMGLETDAKGNFYFGRSGHYVMSKTGANCAVYRMTPDGKKLDIIARGFREPNGVCVGPDGTITLGDNEGNGIPQSPIYRVQEGHFYGYTPNPVGSPKEGGTWKYTEKPIVWLPKQVDGSSAAQVWAPLKGWGPLGGQLLHTSYGNCALFTLLIDKKAEPWQGAVWKFPMYFDSGLMRAKFNPVDGQLYVCGLRGWGTTGQRDGVFSRIRFTGSEVPVPTGFEVVKKGLQVTFSQPLDRKYAEDEQSWSGNWMTNFGGKKEDLPIESASLSPDGRTATVLLESIRPVVNFELHYELKSAKGERISGDLNGTIHRIP
jgi:hypothetical protein